MVTVVSGVPRSGTSLMMQMLRAGGMTVLTDGQRSADANNPRGYYEVDLVKSLQQHPEVVSQAEGKAVKIISSLLTYLPSQHNYAIIFMRRALEEVVRSQDRMLERLGREVSGVGREAVVRAFERHLDEIDGWLTRQSNMKVFYVNYAYLLEDARREAPKISSFLGEDLDIESMTRVVDQSLYREKIPISATGTRSA